MLIYQRVMLMILWVPKYGYHWDNLYLLGYWVAYNFDKTRGLRNNHRIILGIYIYIYIWAVWWNKCSQQYNMLLSKMTISTWKWWTYFQKNSLEHQFISTVPCIFWPSPGNVPSSKLATSNKTKFHWPKLVDFSGKLRVCELENHHFS